MTPEYLLARLIEHGKKMRTAQKNYFATKSFEQEKKQGFLSESKSAERQFDLLLDQAEQLFRSIVKK